MIYEFNQFVLDTENFKLTHNNEEVSVEPQVLNLIILLIENRDRVISRDYILENIWKDKVVSDTSINNHIKSARKALSDDGIKQHTIKTLHSRGYQFIADTENTQEKINNPIKNKNPYLLISLLSMVVILLFLYIRYDNQNKLKLAVQRIINYQEISYLTFVAQAKRRNELVEMIESRVGKTREMQFEKYFSYYFDSLNEEEMFVFGQIRGMTEVGLYQNNLKVFNELNKHPQILTQIPNSKELQLHLEFWLNKYNSVFKQRKDMCLLYVGVEDGVPYPKDINKNLKDWLKQN